MSDLFAEVFPAALDGLPTLAAYRLQLDDDGGSAGLNRLGARLARSLGRAFPGAWLWLDDRIVTDSERSAVELMITLDILKSEKPRTYGALLGLESDPGWQPTPRILADFLLHTHLENADIRSQMQAALDKIESRLPAATIEREYKLQAWVVDGQPAISISIASRLLYQKTLLQYVGGTADRAGLNEKLADLWVMDKVSGVRGQIVRAAGTLADQRERLLETAQDSAHRQRLQNAPDSEWVLTVRAGEKEYRQIASALQLVVPIAQMHRYDLDPRQATLALQMQPSVRAAHVKAVSDVAKAAGLLENAYNSRTTPDLFFSADFEMNLRFSDNRVRAYDPQTLPHDFTQCGVYKLRSDYKKTPVRACVVNALPFRIEDFVEAMERQLQRHFDFRIEIIRERQVRVVSRANLESAVRVVEKEDPDIILTFFDEGEGDDDAPTDVEATASYIKSLTLGRGIPNHVINLTTLNDPDAMPVIIMGILGKTGSSPFVLAEPLEHADYVAGLDIVRDYVKTTGETRLTAIARIYRADGEFLRYVVRDLSIQEGALPYALLRDLFPQRAFAGKRVVVHHDGPLPDDLLTALSHWGQAIGATFYPVEIRRFGAPRIYATERGGVAQPPWGSAFKLSDNEALVISSLPQDDITPQPLHIHTAGETPLPVEKALRGVLVWTLLAYGAERLPKQPVTVLNTEQLARWLRRGGTFGANEGAVPFWL
jgi:hypothetical protein